jgi:hypothetical protein
MNCMYNETTSCLPRNVNEELISYYAQSFKKSFVVVRYPHYTSAYHKGLGYLDDSFTYYTLSGSYNGGQSNGVEWFFWNSAIFHNVSNFWTRRPMCGEVRPGKVFVQFTLPLIQSVFLPSSSTRKFECFIY